MLLPAVAAAGCGLAPEEGARVQVARIAVVAPLSGKFSGAGTAARNAVDLALREAGQRSGLEGWQVELSAIDDSSGDDSSGDDSSGDDSSAAEPARELARDLADDDELVAVVTASQGVVLRALQPPLDRAGVLTVAVADDDPMTTRGADPQAPLRPYEAYFRTNVAPASAAVAAAPAVLSRLGEGSVLVVHDGSPAGVTEAGIAAAAAADSGRTVAGTVAVGAPQTPDDGALRAELAQAAQGVRAVYLAAGAETAARVLAALPGGAAVVGGPLLRASDLPARGGEAAAGIVAATAAVARDSAAAEAFAAAYAQAGFDVDAGTQGAAAYDAAQAVLAALARCLPVADSVPDARDGCVAVMPEVRANGATGQVAFDGYGDRVTAPAVAIAQGGQWVAATDPDGTG